MKIASMTLRDSSQETHNQYHFAVKNGFSLEWFPTHVRISHATWPVVADVPLSNIKSWVPILELKK